jgi:hypothetical protein
LADDPRTLSALWRGVGVEQAQPNGLFQGADPARPRGIRHPDRFGGMTEAARFNDLHE